VVFSTHQSGQFGKALRVRVSHKFTAESAVFDEGNLVSCAGLVPVMALVEQNKLQALLRERVHITAPPIKSGSANPAPKPGTLIAGMCAGADGIDDVDVIRSGGMKTVFAGLYGSSTVGKLLRKCTFGHARQLESVLREHLVALCGRVHLLSVQISRCSSTSIHCCARSTATPNRGVIRAHQDRRQANPAQGPVPAGDHDLHPGRRANDRRNEATAGKTNSSKGAGPMVAQAIRTARDCSASGKTLVRGDSAYGNRKVVRAACATAPSSPW
jgi:hypothetical protein